jgi:rhodanese-related sulfurtransferase
MDFLSRMFGPALPNLSAAEVSEKLKAGKRPLIVDVRQPEEYRQGHIAGAKLIPLGELDNHLKELSTEREIICVCQSGSRSVAATRQLAAAGYNVINMKGGMLAWEWAKLPVKKGNAA